ncbi:DUF6301 family protein [Nocardia sp. AG03]|uniref:DUF6301 family protein n=1 Tax=Nocardia sp. AG03 TaxID=3025312 RepID=UPI0024186681|nr:DUF6301 family protein [Nocardia sp. AG03]
MRVDLDRLRDAIRLAVAFDWTGSSDDIESFCCSANWTIVHRHKYGADFSTNMGINRPTGRCFVQDSRMRYMTFGVSDVLDPESAGSGALSLARFWDMADLLFDELGEPGRGSRNERIYFRWDLPNITIFAIGNSRENYIRLVDREFQAEQDYIDENIIARRDEI